MKMQNVRIFVTVGVGPIYRQGKTRTFQVVHLKLNSKAIFNESELRAYGECLGAKDR